MKTCPNCGSSNADNMNFCNNCGASIKDVAPAQEQQVQASSFAQVEDTAVQPTVVEPTPVVAKPIESKPQASYNFDSEFDSQPKKTNGLCLAGFIVSLVSILTVGTTAIISLILCICGLASASKKGNKKGLGIAGLIISIILTLIGAFFIFSVTQGVIDEMDNVKSYSRSYDDDEDDEEDEDDEDDEDDDDDKDSKKSGKSGAMSSSDIKKKIRSNNWVETHDTCYLVLNSDESFLYYKEYADLKNNYYEGDFDLYVGEDAYEYITNDLEDYGVTEEELDGMFERNEMYDLENFVVLVLNSESCMVDGENTLDGTVSSPYFGFYVTDGDEVALDIANMNSYNYYWFVPESDYQG